MEKVSDPIILSFLTTCLIEFYLFGMQRATLKISRHNNIQWKGIGEHLLPNWYPLTWVVRIFKYGLLITIVFVFGWIWAICLLFASFVFSVNMPIPYRLLYRQTFRNKVKKISLTDPNAGQAFSEMLDNTKF